MSAERVRQFYIPSGDHSMYVEQWSAGGPSLGTMVLVHGGHHTGVCWTQPPGGLLGWAPYFAGLGWDCHVVDWPGVGRSGFGPDFVSMGAAPIAEALERLLDQVGPGVLVGHSVGAAIALRVADRRPDLVTALVAAMPAPVGNIPFAAPAADESAPIFLSRAMARSLGAATDRFPIEAFDEYFASTVPQSPRVFNGLGARTGDDLVLRNLDVLRALPTLVLAADEDRAATRDLTVGLAELLEVPHVVLGEDWGLPGFGHMAPIERGTDLIAGRVADWLAAALHDPGQRDSRPAQRDSA